MIDKKETVEVTEIEKSPFRLFNKIEYVDVKVPTKWGDASFSIRPMTNTERAIFSMEEDEIKKSRDVSGAIERSGFSNEELYTSEEDKTKDILKNWSTVLSDTVVDKDAEKVFLNSIKKVLIDCTRTVTVGDDTHDFDNDMYEEMNGDSVRLWLLSEIRMAGDLTVGERLAL